MRAAHAARGVHRHMLEGGRAPAEGMTAGLFTTGYRARPVSRS
jgi:hypothetical protein